MALVRQQCSVQRWRDGLPVMKSFRMALGVEVTCAASPLPLWNAWAVTGQSGSCCRRRCCSWSRYIATWRRDTPASMKLIRSSAGHGGIAQKPYPDCPSMDRSDPQFLSISGSEATTPEEDLKGGGGGGGRGSNMTRSTPQGSQGIYTTSLLESSTRPR